MTVRAEKELSLRVGVGKGMIIRGILYVCVGDVMDVVFSV